MTVSSLYKREKKWLFTRSALNIKSFGVVESLWATIHLCIVVMTVMTSSGVY